jgi:hypothetical protein
MYNTNIRRDLNMRKEIWIIGFIAFALGLLTAIAGSIIAPRSTEVILILVGLGIVVGIINVTKKETITFMVATIALVVVGDVLDPIKHTELGSLFDNMLSLIATFMAPAAIIAAIKALVSVGFPGETL